MSDASVSLVLNPYQPLFLSSSTCISFSTVPSKYSFEEATTEFFNHRVYNEDREKDECLASTRRYELHP